MHKSRFGTIVIDCQGDDIEAAATFWSQALGWKTRPQGAGSSPNYRQFDTPPDQPTVLVQAVSHPSRVHLDIETDNVEAEVRRLEQLGARRVQQVKTWWVMEAPTGQRFCVVRPQRPDFPAGANAWNEEP